MIVGENFGWQDPLSFADSFCSSMVYVPLDIPTEGSIFGSQMAMGITELADAFRNIPFAFRRVSQSIG